MFILEREPNCLNKLPKWTFGFQPWRNARFGFVSCCFVWIIKWSWAVDDGWSPLGAPSMFLTRVSRASGEKNIFPGKPSCKQVHFSCRKKDLSCWVSNGKLHLFQWILEMLLSWGPVSWIGFSQCVESADIWFPKIFPNAFKTIRLVQSAQSPSW